MLLQALMPVAVFVVGCAFSTEKFSLGTFGNMIVVSIGVAIASYGALPVTPATRLLRSHECPGTPAASHGPALMRFVQHYILSEPKWYLARRRAQLRGDWGRAAAGLNRHRVHPPCVSPDPATEVSD